MAKVTARFVFRGRSFKNVLVLNPGACKGKSWLLVLDTSQEPALFVVEAASATSALDVLADGEEHGDLVRIQDHERGDYGFRLAAGTVVGGFPLMAASTINLRGEVVPEDQSDYVREPNVSGSGTYYDGESLLVYGGEGAEMPFRVTYHGDGFPEVGLTPQEFASGSQE